MEQSNPTKIVMTIYFSILGVAIGVEELECEEKNAIIEWYRAAGPRTRY